MSQAVHWAAIILPTLLLISIFVAVMDTERSDELKINKKWSKACDETRRYVRSVSLVPVWRRHLVATLIASFFVAVGTSVLVRGDERMRVVAGVYITSILATWMVLQGSSGYFKYHILTGERLQ